MCVECLIGKLKKPILFKVTEPSSIPYRTPPACGHGLLADQDRDLLAHAESVLYGMELGSVTLKRIGFFCFPIKHSTHTRPRNNTQCCRSAVGRPLGQRWILGQGLRVGGPGTPPFWRRTWKEFCTVEDTKLSTIKQHSLSVWYRDGTRLGDLKENWFVLFSKLNTQHAHTPR